MITGVDHHLAHGPGAILYLCGVTVPYRHADNFHLAAQVDPAADPIVMPLVRGQQLTLTGARRIRFDGEAAARLYPDRPAPFLTCRNFQFGASFFGG